jgi:hypothetical protein
VKYRKKEVVEAITFDEITKYSKERGQYVYTNHEMQWQFEYFGYLVAYKFDQCYLIHTIDGLVKLFPGNVLMIDTNGRVYTYNDHCFNDIYEPINE